MCHDRLVASVSFKSKKRDNFFVFLIFFFLSFSLLFSRCKKNNRFVAVEPFLIDVSEFTAERPSLAVPDSDVFDDVLDKVADDQVPAALSESAATTSTTGQQQRAKSAKKATSRDLSASIAAAQPIPTTAELLALDASPQSAKSRRATASRHASLVQASPSATLELKAQTPAAVTVIDITEQRPQRRSQSQSREPVAVAPPASIVATEPQSVSSKFTNVSKLATKRSSTQFKPPNKRSNSGGGGGGTADEFEFDDNDETKQTSTRNKQQPKAASTETIDLITAESSSLDKVKADTEQTPKSSKKKATADKKRKEAPVVVDIAQPEPTPPPPPAKKPRSAKSAAAAAAVVATPVESSATESPTKSSKRPKKTKTINVNQHDDNANGGADDEWLSAASVSVVLTGGGDSSKRIEERAKQLGVHVSSDVTTRTTHVVVLSELRTMKVLLGIAQRLWLVQPQWIDDGDDKRGLPVSQKYEVTCFAGARRARTGAAPPLDGVSVWFAGTDTQPPMKDLKQLLKLAGGKVVTAVGKADVVIAGRNSTVWHRGADDEKPVVKENWLLNCVSSWAKEPFEAHFAREVDAGGE
jgi:NAD-dependent DNA ligase